MAVSSVVAGDWLKDVVTDAIQKQAEQLLEAEIADISVRVRDAMRESLAQTVLSVMNNYHVMRQGSDLVIHVRIGELHGR